MRQAMLTPAGADAPTRTAVEVPRRDYRYEGLLIGGLALGADGELGRAVAVGLVGAAVGGGLGYLIGRLSGKPSVTVDSTRP